MRNKKRLSLVLLSILLTMSMLIILVACKNDGNNSSNDQGGILEPSTYATITFKSDLSDVGQTIKIDTDPSKIPEGFTLKDLFDQDTETKYGFKVEKNGSLITAIKGSKIEDLIPNTMQFIAIYSTKEETGSSTKAPILCNGKTYYLSDAGINQIKLETGIDYLFVLESSYYDNMSQKIYEKYLFDFEQTEEGMINPLEYVEVSDIAEYNNNIYIIKCLQDSPDNIEKPTLIKIDSTGNIDKTVVLKGGNSYAFPKPIIAGENIICATNGSIEAFNVNTLERVWECKEDIVATSQQTYYQMTLDKNTGIIYIGLYFGAKQNGKIIALDTRNGEKSKFKPVEAGLFYRGKMAIAGDYLIAPGIINGKNSLVSINKNTGYKVDEVLLNEQISTEAISNARLETPIVYNKNEKSIFYVVSERKENNINAREASFTVRTWFENGEFKTSKDLKLAYEKSVAEPLFFGNKMYIFSGVAGYTNEEGAMQAIDINNMSEIYRIKTTANTEGKPYLKKLNENEIIILFTTKEDNGSLQYVIENSKTGKYFPKTIYKPKNYSWYSTSSVLMSENGTIYYTFGGCVVAFDHVKIK